MSCQPSAMSAGAPVNKLNDVLVGYKIAISLITAICFPAYNDFSNALVMKDLLKVCLLSHDANIERLSAALHSGVCFFQHPLPTVPSVGLATALPNIGKHWAYPVPLVYQSGLGADIAYPTTHTPMVLHLR